MVRKAKKIMDEKIYLIDLMNLSNHLHILNYGEFDIIKIGIINTSRNLQTFRLCFSLNFRFMKHHKTKQPPGNVGLLDGCCSLVISSF